MPQIAVSTDAIEKSFMANGTMPHTNHYYLKPDFIGGPIEVTEGPCAFQVGMLKHGDVLRAHFHLVDQFQVVVAGGGLMGKHELHPTAVHYADAYTPYGPLVAGPKGLFYFTMRAQTDHTGSHFMPDSRDKMKERNRRAGRDVTADVDVNPAESLYRKETVVNELIPLHQDRLGAYVVRAGPGAKAIAPTAKGSGGQICLVIHGSGMHGQKELPLWTTIYVSPDEAALQVTAGPSGLDVLVLQFPAPKPAWVPSSEPRPAAA